MKSIVGVAVGAGVAVAVAVGVGVTPCDRFCKGRNNWYSPSISIGTGLDGSIVAAISSDDSGGNAVAIRRTVGNGVAIAPISAVDSIMGGGGNVGVGPFVSWHAANSSAKIAIKPNQAMFKPRTLARFKGL